MKKIFGSATLEVVFSLLVVVAVLSFSANAKAIVIDIPIQSVEVYSDGDSYLYSGSNLIQYTNEDFECLVANIFHEARNQNRKGKMMVASATLYRTTMKRYPNTICGVVKFNSRNKNNELKNGGCSFSWVCSKLNHEPNLDNAMERKAWGDAIKVAVYALQNDSEVLSTKITHYHTKTVNPFWSKHLTVVGTFGDHIAYTN
jgi:spore germination cell wall hydrolase CwlJ-like protein